MFFKKKTEEKSKRVRVGYYDCKPLNQLYNDLTYAKEVCLFNSDEIKIFGRGYKGCLYKIIVATNFDTLLEFDYSNENLRDLNMSTDFEDQFSLEEFKNERMVEVIIIEENTPRTIAYAKKEFVVSKKHFRQILLLEKKEMVLEYHRLMPDYYRLYKDFCNVVFFDMAIRDKEII